MTEQRSRTSWALYVDAGPYGEVQEAVEMARDQEEGPVEQGLSHWRMTLVTLEGLAH